MLDSLFLGSPRSPLRARSLLPVLVHQAHAIRFAREGSKEQSRAAVADRQMAAMRVLAALWCPWVRRCESERAACGVAMRRWCALVRRAERQDALYRQLRAVFAKVRRRLVRRAVKKWGDLVARLRLPRRAVQAARRAQGLCLLDAAAHRRRAWRRHAAFSAWATATLRWRAEQKEAALALVLRRVGLRRSLACVLGRSAALRSALSRWRALANWSRHLEQSELQLVECARQVSHVCLLPAAQLRAPDADASSAPSLPPGRPTTRIYGSRARAC